MLNRQRAVEFLCIAAPKVVGGMLLILMNIALMRFFEPAQYGVYSLCVTSIILIDVIVGTSVDMGVLRLAPLYRNEDYGRSIALELAGVSFKLMVGVALLALAALFSEQVSSYLFEQEDGASLIYLTVFSGVALLLFRSTLVHLQLEQRFGLYGLVEWAHNIVKYGVIAVLLIAFSPGPAQVLLAFAITSTFACVLGYWVMSQRVVQSNWRGHKGIFKKLFNFVKWYALTIVVGTLISRMDVYFVGILGGVDQAGIFSAALVIALIPEILGTYLAVVFNPRIMTYWQERQFYPLYRRVQIALYVVAVFIFVLALLIVEYYSEWLIPRDYKQAEEIFLVLLLGTLAGMVTYPLTASFLMFMRPKFLLKLECSAFPFIVASYIYAIDIYGLLGAAWVTALSRLIRALVSQTVAWRVARTN